MTRDFKFEVKSTDEQGIFTGYASIFGNVDRGGDIVFPSAFRKTLSDSPELPVLWNHSELIGRTLEAREDARGLFVKGELNLDVQRGREAYALAKQGAVRGLSFAFETVPGKTEMRDGRRILKEVRLYEVSMTPFPMNPEARISDVKGDDDRREALAALRTAGGDLKKFYESLL